VARARLRLDRKPPARTRNQIDEVPSEIRARARDVDAVAGEAHPVFRMPRSA